MRHIGLTVGDALEMQLLLLLLATANRSRVSIRVKNGRQGVGHGRPCKNFPFTQFDQNFIAVCHTVWAYIRV